MTAGAMPDLRALAKELGRPISTMEVLSADPFRAGDERPRVEAAEWFAEMWRRFDIQPGAHIRRIHYVFVSQLLGNVKLPDGSPYINTEKAYAFLNRASLDARYLQLVSADDIVDRRNDEPMIYLITEMEAPLICSSEGDYKTELTELSIPRLEVYLPKILQRYHVEIWCEKSTMNDILMPLGPRYGINIVTGIGEMSYTRVVQLVKRVLASRRPLRILYISDFDPAGNGMPVSVARKVEFLLYQKNALDLDVQLRHIVLTHEQCIAYRLPRTPIKGDSESAAGRKLHFEERFGEGATELDALEALHPGELEQILLREIERYYDDTLDDRIAEVGGEVEADLDRINDEVHERHAEAIAEVEAERKKVLAAIKAFERMARPVFRMIEEELDDEAPDVGQYEWPEPEEGDEDDDPLFDSTRDFITQTDRYKAHQGKPTVSKWKNCPKFTLTCANPDCGKTFEAEKPQTKWMACSHTCREILRYRAAHPEAVSRDQLDQRNPTSIRQLARAAGLSHGTVRLRMAAGMSQEQALAMPRQQGRKHGKTAKLRSSKPASKSGSGAKRK